MYGYSQRYYSKPNETRIPLTNTRMVTMLITIFAHRNMQREHSQFAESVTSCEKFEVICAFSVAKCVTAK